ncbi:cobalamin-dependent protein [Paenibacillus sp. PsM32]|uniref:cobalamin B12-binding domain-containing protein n=1 Tax=unclassified Paenibacillus TaxID=185978 RepID=UPI00263A6901|nr:MULTISPECIES: cobalamin-dependent protein [unclassified Paenibacillus]MDN4616633.1 cobalamin-dependent protein [Paenibacillus sp. PsM32]MDQ1233576.1 methylmalonyl-CoA mutase cobalamin-binding domain/chain [Paenibacillus sp. SORGH_AS_0306]MDR6110618.1 methylmalonyl-CoA mutase cobalamin-binding domain/chain [Paenibacillus sp. SORGH_AS_0338]
MALQREETAGQQLISQADRFAEKVTQMQYRQQPDLMQRFGSNGRIRTKQDSLYTISYLAESVLMKSPSLFMNYISWLKVLLNGYRVSEQDLLVNLHAIKKALQKSFDHPHKSNVIDYLDMGIHHVQTSESQTSYMLDTSLLGKEAKQYLDCLLRTERKEAYALIVHLLENDTPIKDIYIHIFQTVQYEIGRLWQIGDINIAQEHFCTAATQSIISRLYPYWISAGEERYRLVAACVGEEQHEIGIRMLADFFEMEGWNTYYLGANVPDHSLLQSIVHHQADVIAISATMTFHVHLVQDLIEKIRAEESTRDVKIIVGGLPFNIDRELWKRVGADGFAPDANEAVEIATSLVALNESGSQPSVKG